ncbi:MAG: hypothetical protein HYT31_02450 [Parcubacteria group bacterium]|nr:hypothetical protein [Parcubacteria group bacterium]
MVNFNLDNLSFAEQETLRKNLLAGIPQDIADPKALLEWEKRTAIAVVYTRTAFAYRLLQTLRGLLAGSGTFSAPYVPVLTWLYYAAFLSLTKQDLAHFAREADVGLILADENYGDIITKLKSRLLLESLDERDGFREGVFNALHENETILTKQFSFSGKFGTISAWLKEYDSALGQSPVENYQLNEFVSKHKLSVLEKNIAQRFFNFYEFVKTSSYDARGFEEDIFFTDPGGRHYLLADGQQIDLGAVSKLAPATFSARTETEGGQPAALPLYADIASRSQKMLISISGNAKTLFETALRHIEAQDASNTLASLLLLAQLRQLDNLVEDPRFAKLVIDDLKKAGRDDNIAGIRMNPGAPQYLARLLKVILEDRLGLSREDALAFGSRLSKILVMEGEKYQTIIKNSKWNV